jgi:hypothetical protein
MEAFGVLEKPEFISDWTKDCGNSSPGENIW